MYCIYLRKSRKDTEFEKLGEGETLYRHRNTLLEYAKRLNIPIDEIYEEIVSGESISSRPVMQRLLTDVENRKWQGVFVMEIERLARGDTTDQGIVASTFKKSDTKIYTPNKIYDPDNEFDEEYFEFGLFMSRREYKTINRRLQRGRLLSVKEGKFIGSTPPFGYNKIKLQKGKGYKLEINEIEEPVIKYIFTEFSKDKSSTEIIQHLNNINAPGTPWTSSHIRSIITNPVYTGKIRWGRNKQISLNKREIQSDYILVQGLHKGIITENLFNEANKKIPLPTVKMQKNIFSEIAYCGICGSKMRVHTQRGKAKLRCVNQNNCKNIAIDMELVEKYTLDKIKPQMEEKTSPSSSPLTKNTIEKNKLKLKNQLNKIYTLLEQGIYDTQTFTQRKSLIENKLSLLEKEVNSTTEPTFLHLYQSSDAKAKNKILKKYIKRIDIIKKDKKNYSISVTPNPLS